MSELVDTLLNIEVFAFIALLVWLYIKPSALDQANGVDAVSTSNEDTALDDR